MYASKLLAAVCFTVALSPALAQTYTYDAVSIKPAQPQTNTNRTRMGGVNITDDGIFAINTSLRALIASAYNVKTDDITGLSESLNSNYDVQGKLDEAAATALAELPVEQRDEQRRLMLQSVLASRFHLKAHVATKEASIFALVITKSGAKLPSIDPTAPRSGPAASFGAGRHDSSAETMKNLASFLARLLQRPVEDRTGLTGSYKISLRWEPEAGDPYLDPGAPPTGAPALPTALEEQLGLKLEPTRGPVQTIVVDHVERPTAD